MNPDETYRLFMKMVAGEGAVILKFNTVFLLAIEGSAQNEMKLNHALSG